MSKQFLNNQLNVVRDSINGLLWQNPTTLTRVPGTDAIVTKNVDTSKVAIICGGGSGHEPSHAGFVFDGALDGAVCGGVFASPSHKSIFETLKYFKDCKKGVLVVVKAYQGDIINFGFAAQLAKAQLGLNVEVVVFGEDVTFAIEGDARRGLAGTTLLYKILGQIAAQNRNDNSFNVQSLASKAKSFIDGNMFKTYGVALQSCTLPGKHKPNVDLGETEMELGLGIHGEAGNERLKSIITVDEIVAKMIERVLPSSTSGKQQQQQEEIVLALNNLGSVTELEMGIIVNSIMNQIFDTKNETNRKLVRFISGRFMTSLDMKGVSLTSISSSNVDTNEWRNVILPALDVLVPSSIQFSCVNTESFSTKTHKPISDNEVTGFSSQSAVPVVVETSPEATLFKSLLEKIFNKIIESADTFDELDAAVGDGDMGRGVARGMRAAIAALPKLNFSENVRESFSELGSAIADAHAGSSGPMVGVMVALAGSKFSSNQSSEILSNGSKALESFLQGFADGVGAVQTIGGAQEGDRTMVDVLSPLRAAILAYGGKMCERGWKATLEEMIKLGKEKAAGAAQLTAKKGRSRYAEERCIGKPDPGCEFVVFVLETILSVLSS